MLNSMVGFFCNPCKLRFSNNSTFQSHKSLVHEQNGEMDDLMLVSLICQGDVLFTCSICKTEFALKNHLIKHMASAHEETKPSSYDEADSSFTQQDYLIGHMKAVHGGKKSLKSSIWHRRKAWLDIFVFHPNSCAVFNKQWPIFVLLIYL